MNNKIKILGIAPYPGLVTLMKQYAQNHTEISLTPVLGNLEEGCSIAMEQYQNYDVIISRANTADIISKAIPIPVFDIGISYYDVLRCIKMAENTNNKFALIGFPTLTDIAHTISDLLKMKLDIFPIRTSSETLKIIDAIKSMGFQTVICDTIAYEYAKSIGLKAILLTSSSESLTSAINNAKYIWKINKSNFQSISMMKHALNSNSSSCLIIDVKQVCLYSNLSYINSSDIQKQLSSTLDLCINTRNRSFFITSCETLYSIISEYVEDALSPYVIFHITPSKIPLTSSKYGITIINKEDAKTSFISSFFSNTNLSSTTITNPETHTLSDSTLMISGERGTGKDPIAHLYYVNSTYCNNPLFIINCSLINEKNWQFITNNYKSPFTDNGNTIYISNLEQLSRERQKQLLSIISDTNVHIRNRLIFSCSLEQGHVLPHVAIEYSNILNTVLIPLKPLRESKDEIITSANLYINILNQEYGTQVVGLNDEAIKLLLDFDFPYNHTQFKRILKQAILKTLTPYVLGETILEILRDEQKYVHPLHPPYSEVSTHISQINQNEFHLNLNLSLDEINHTIIQYVLAQNNGNQSATAKKLGISRTTLWRYLNH